MWAARLVPDDAPLPEALADALADNDPHRLAALVGPDLGALAALTERLAFYELVPEALALVDAATAAGHVVPRQSACLAASVLLQNGDLAGALARFARCGLDDTRLLIDAADELWGEQHHALAVAWSTRAVMHALECPEDDGLLAEAVTARHLIASRLGLLHDEGFCPRTTLPRPADALEERAVARLLARPWADLSPDESAALCSTVFRVSDAMLAAARPLVVGWFPCQEWPEAARVWSDLAASGPTWDDHRGDVDLAASAAEQRLHPVLLVRLTVAEVCADAARRHQPMDARWVRDTYAFDLAVTHGRGVPWPPEADAACWCGSALAYADCCASRVPAQVRDAALVAFEDFSRFF